MATAAAAVCAQCHNPLTVTVDPDDSSGSDVDMGTAASDNDDEQPRGRHEIPDDVHLPCGDHFHWECLLDAYEHDKCPHCARTVVTHLPSSSSSSSSSSSALAAAGAGSLPAPQPRLIVDMHNEGGRQGGIDIMPLLREESYLRAYPEETASRAFLELCREGDHRAIVDLLRHASGEAEDGDEDGEDDALDDDDDVARPRKSTPEILRYQDPLGELQSGLHAAVANGHLEVAWLLLLLASTFPETEFPAPVSQEAAVLGIMRDDQDGLVDIRSLTDERGRTAEDVARESGGVWHGWIGNGRLAMPGAGGEHGNRSTFTI